MKNGNWPRPRVTSAHLIAVAALIAGTAGSATAVAKLTGSDIKDATITSADIKNRSLKVRDIKKSELKKLKGQRGPTGPQGATGPQGPAGPMGASAFSAPPSGTLVVGGGVVDRFINTQAPSPLYAYMPLPFRAGTAFSKGAGRNIWYAPSPSVVDSEENAAACTGSYVSPDPKPGHLCVYVVDAEAQHVNPQSGAIAPGVSLAGDGADSSGFTVNFNSSGTPDQVRFAFVWAYRAP